MFALARDGTRGRGARADPALAAGAPGGAQRRGGAAAGPEQRKRGADGAAVQEIYGRCSGRSTGFWRRRSAAIVFTSLYLIRSNRRLFARARRALRERRELAQTADRDARVDASRNLTRAARRVRSGPDGDRVRCWAAPGTRCRKVRRCARNCARSARSRRRRSTTSAACPRRCTRRCSRRPGSRATIDWYLSTVERQTGRRSVVRAHGAPCAGGRRRRHSCLPRAAGSAEQRRAPFRGRRAPGCGCEFETEALELDVEDHGKGFDAERSAAWPRRRRHARTRRAARRDARVPAPAGGRHARAPHRAGCRRDAAACTPT